MEEQCMFLSSSWLDSNMVCSVYTDSQRAGDGFEHAIYPWDKISGSSFSTLLWISNLTRENQQINCRRKEFSFTRDILHLTKEETLCGKNPFIKVGNFLSEESIRLFTHSTEHLFKVSGQGWADRPNSMIVIISSCILLFEWYLTYISCYWWIVRHTKRIDDR